MRETPDDPDALEAAAEPAVLGEAGAALLFTRARTAYDFTDEPLSDADLEAIHALAKWAPTAVNGQPLRIVAVRSPEAKARLLPLLPRGNREQSASAPVTLVLGADLAFQETLTALHPRGARYRDLMREDAGLRRSMAISSAYIQAGFLIEAIRARGFAAGPMSPMNEDALRDEYFPGSQVEPILLVNLGRPSASAFQERNPRLGFADAWTIL